jgi:hypothetical protein
VVTAALEELRETWESTGNVRELRLALLDLLQQLERGRE